MFLTVLSPKGRKKERKEKKWSFIYVPNASKLKVRSPDPCGEAGAVVDDEVLLVTSGAGSEDS